MPIFEDLKTLHGGQEYIYERPVVAGDKLKCTKEIVDVQTKQGKTGPMTLIITEDWGEDLSGNLVFLGRRTIILR
ncbi:hydroxyacyl-ACP dehydratase HTD2-like protein with hotdog domain [Neobacillus niacini]|uniref:FAS1-like dehydratase domain-containing protein n=1 Tax=Neobacillus niacini TaxID=86668 RepID=UPI002780B288|nr:MaoC family dehydratase N-terminal domain-containing protein [Neobacillus niacini]MDQ1002234.1 hydroxyacyl-ACP dehydratase HTD2-like protein with hotdog domain [Neobacillus niacini]